MVADHIRGITKALKVNKGDVRYFASASIFGTGAQASAHCVPSKFTTFPRHCLQPSLADGGIFGTPFP